MKLALTVVTVGIADSGVLFGQASNVFPSSGNVGIGTASPVGLLNVAGDGAVSTNYNAYNQLFVTGRTNTSQRLALGYDTASNLGLIQAYVSGGSVMPLILQSAGGNVGVGTTAPQHKLSVNGTIGAKEVIVTNTGWADYVLRPGYRLMPLPDVAKYIQEHGHLPEIPSEAAVHEKGVGVGEMQAKLLAKIEELTLHLIQMELENREIRRRLEQQNLRIAELEARAQ